MIRIFILSIGRSDTLTNKNLAATVIRRIKMKTSINLDEYRGYKNFQTAIEAVQNGNWNGKIYTKKVGNGRNYDLSVYVDNKYFSLGRWGKEWYAEAEEAFKLLANPQETKKETTKGKWLVDGKPVENNLNWAQMWQKYGTDFE